MRVPTVKLRHNRSGLVVKVNVQDYASDLGSSRYAAYSLVTGEADDVGGLKPEAKPEKATHEVKPVRKKRKYTRRKPTTQELDA